MTSPIFIALRRLRAPLLLLIAVYSIGIVGFVLIPGQDPEGRPWRMSIFHAFYFISYTASTIGFGEIPHPFSDAQRMWTTAVIYMSVVGWAYTIGSVLSLGQDRSFREASRPPLRTPPRGRWIVCGYGRFGTEVAADLRAEGLEVTVIDAAEATADDPAIITGSVTECNIWPARDRRTRWRSSRRPTTTRRTCR